MKGLAIGSEAREFRPIQIFLTASQKPVEGWPTLKSQWPISASTEIWVLSVFDPECPKLNCALS